MIKIEKVDVVGWESAIRGMRNSWNSHDKSDTFIATPAYCGDFDDCIECEYSDRCNCVNKGVIIGENDLALMKKLCKAGSDERKFMRMIVVYADITAPMYF